MENPIQDCLTMFVVEHVTLIEMNIENFYLSFMEFHHLFESRGVGLM